MQDPMSVEQEHRFSLALDVAKRAARLTLDRFQDPGLRIDTKLDKTLVTAADRDAEKVIREALADAFPHDGIVGEEFGTTPSGSGWTWYLDPIDGTQAYARGVPLFGTLIGVEHQGESRIGVIVLPALGEAVFAAKGIGCLWEKGIRPEGLDGFADGKLTRAAVSKVSRLEDALFCTTWLKSFEDAGCPDLFPKLARATGVYRGWSDCYGYALVATGRAEIMVDPVLAPWDAGPMPVILAEAGGRYTSFTGSTALDAGSGLATNGVLHDAVMAVIQSR